jgi:hypothetical protein
LSNPSCWATNATSICSTTTAGTSSTSASCAPTGAGSNRPTRSTAK